jgi:hypothetical protein
MSKKPEKKSDVAASESRENASVFDFLYRDSRRIASFLAQLDELGHLQQITQTDHAEEGESQESRTGGHIGVPGALGGKHEGETGVTSSRSESAQRVYDPFWANARRFLDLLEENSLVQRDLEEAKVGQFVLATGYLSVQDLAMFKEAWKLQSIQRQVKGGVAGKKTGNMTAAQKAASQTEKQNTELFLDMIQIMPHSVHARLLTKTGENENTKLVWCALNQDYLVAPASDLTLTYGAMMAGEWSVIGILSAHPEYLTPDLSQEFNEEDLGLTESIIGQLSKILAPIVRVTLGRPAAAHAVTPLLIFRDVSG